MNTCSRACLSPILLFGKVCLFKLLDFKKNWDVCFLTADFGEFLIYSRYKSSLSDT